MTLHIIGKFPSKIVLLVKINGEQYRLDTNSPEIILELKEEGEYDVELESPHQKELHKSKLLFIATCFFQGLYNIIFLKSASRWYKKIIPHSMKASFKIRIVKDVDMYIVYNVAKYDLKEGVWMKPELMTIPATEIHASYEPTYHEFKLRCENFVRRIISVFVALIGSTVYIMLNVSESLYFAILTSILIITLAFFSARFFIARERRKLKIMFEKFTNMK